MMHITKLSILLTFLVLASIGNLLAQGMNNKSNELQIAYKGGVLRDSGPLPKIVWVSPDLEYTYSKMNKVEINANVEAHSTVKEIKLIVSGTDNATIATKSFATKRDLRAYAISTSIMLPDGVSLLSLEVTTETGVTVTDKRQIVTGKEAEDMFVAFDRKDYALLFATDKYDNWDDLANPIDDAHNIARELKEKYGFETEIVENPTVEKIWEKLKEYNERKFNPQDQLLVFFAGHGHYDESFGEGYVVAKNSLRNDASRTTYLSHNRLRGVINNISCRHILLTMDVCFGGTLDPVIASSRGAESNEVSINQMLVRKWSHKTRKYLTSGGKEYVSDGISGKHSPFAGKLIESLRSLDDNDPMLTMVELQGNFEKLQQLPRFGSFGDDEALSDFVFLRKKQ